MKKQYCFLLLLTFLVSCNDPISKSEQQTLPSTSISLIYPIGTGTSGDTSNGLLGYGYDASGFCDTISVRAKVLESLPAGSIYYGGDNTVFPTIISGGNFGALLDKINNPYRTESGEALGLHLKSLLRLALNTDSINPEYAYTYYATTYYDSRRSYHYGSDIQQYLSSDFKNDEVSLSPKELVLKYGTHVLTDVFTGTKFEMLYRCKFKNNNTGVNYNDIVNDCEGLFYNRLKEYTGGTPGIITDINSNTKLSQTDEQLIYNSQGSRIKMCGLINATDNNPDSIRLNINSLFKENNIKTQFISVGQDGLFPIYELINDVTKKQELKTYIEKNMTAKKVN